MLWGMKDHHLTPTLSIREYFTSTNLYSRKLAETGPVTQHPSTIPATNRATLSDLWHSKYGRYKKHAIMSDGKFK